MYNNLPNITNWTQYTTQPDIVSIVEATQLLISQQNQTFTDFLNIGGWNLLKGELLDWVAFKQWGLRRPSSYASNSRYDIGEYEVDLYDITDSQSLVNDFVFKKYIFFMVRRDITHITIPNIITQICDFTELQREDITLTINNNLITITMPKTPLTEYFQVFTQADFFYKPLSFEFKINLL